LTRLFHNTDNNRRIGKGIILNRKTLWVVMLLLVTLLPSCSRYDSEDGFETVLSSDGSSVWIVRYLGNKNNIRIPRKIKKLPVSRIGDNAFSNPESGLVSVTIPNTVTSIGDSAFQGCSNLVRLTIPKSVTIIEDAAFAGCTGLTSVIIPNKVTSIGACVFFLCESLTVIIIPAGVTSIGEWAFSRCAKLTAINAAVDNKAYTSHDGILYNKDKTILIAYPAGKTDASFIIPDYVTGIGGGAFAGCENLTSITIPNSVTSIGDNAFGDCTRLTNINIPDNITVIKDMTFSQCTVLAGVTIPDSVTSIGAGAFSGCISLAGIIIPNGVTGIGKAAFHECTGLTGVTIPNNVTVIEDSVFSYCTNLKSIIIPNSVKIIEYSAFTGCASLKSVTFQGRINPGWFDNDAFWGLGDLRDKFYEKNSRNGTPGTYTTTAPVVWDSVWMRQR
jgi:hypothetical protein